MAMMLTTSAPRIRPKTRFKISAFTDLSRASRRSSGLPQLAAQSSDLGFQLGAQLGDLGLQLSSERGDLGLQLSAASRPRSALVARSAPASAS